MWNDFKAFVMRGNVLDLAVGVIIGAAFGKIVSSFVADVLTPILSIGMGKVDFSNLFVALNGENYATLAAAKAAGASTINYGIFINAVIDFLIMALAVFLILRAAQKVRVRNTAPGTKECPFCKSAINIAAVRCPACTSQLS